MHRPLGDPWVIYVYCGTIVTLGEGIPVCTDHWVTHGYIIYVYSGTIVTLGEGIPVCTDHWVTHG